MDDLFFSIYMFTLPWFVALMSIPFRAVCAILRTCARHDIERLERGSNVSERESDYRKLHDEFKNILHLPVEIPFIDGPLLKTYKVLDKLINLLDARKRRMWARKRARKSKSIRGN